jgi:alpha-tubulin suppressor-like RCC1 family protein
MQSDNDPVEEGMKMAQATRTGWATRAMGRPDGSWHGGTTPQTTVPAPNEDFVMVASGYEHSLGLKTDGSIVAWGGANFYGQVDGPYTGQDSIAIAAGAYHNVALKANGSLEACLGLP